MTIYIVVIILLLDFVFAVFLYNRLVKHKQLVNEAWSGIDVQLKRRHDLIPNIVESVKGYSSHEVETLTEVISSRSHQTVRNPDNSQILEIATAEKLLGGSIKQLFALAESILT